MDCNSCFCHGNFSSKGLVAWNEIMADISEGEDYIEIEATAWQFAWNLRYPGQDGKLGVKDFRLIKAGKMILDKTGMMSEI